jgi:hypothetical protein
MQLRTETLARFREPETTFHQPEIRNSPAAVSELLADDSVECTSEFFEQIHDSRRHDWYQANEHCHFVPGLIRYANNYELLAAVAPRPLLIVAASVDQSFPIDGVRAVHQYGQGLYRSYDAANSRGSDIPETESWALECIFPCTRLPPIAGANFRVPRHPTVVRQDSRREREADCARCFRVAR